MIDITPELIILIFKLWALTSLSFFFIMIQISKRTKSLHAISKDQWETMLVLSILPPLILVMICIISIVYFYDWLNMLKIKQPLHKFLLKERSFRNGR